MEKIGVIKRAKNRPKIKVEVKVVQKLNQMTERKTGIGMKMLNMTKK